MRILAVKISTRILADKLFETKILVGIPDMGDGQKTMLDRDFLAWQKVIPDRALAEVEQRAFCIPIIRWVG